MGAVRLLLSSNNTILLLSQATPGLKKCYHENIGLSVMKVGDSGENPSPPPHPSPSLPSPSPPPEAAVGQARAALMKVAAGLSSRRLVRWTPDAGEATPGGGRRRLCGERWPGVLARVSGRVGGGVAASVRWWHAEPSAGFCVRSGEISFPDRCFSRPSAGSA
jgi:hypothetical protein